MLVNHERITSELGFGFGKRAWMNLGLIITGEIGMNQRNWA